MPRRDRRPENQKPPWERALDKPAKAAKTQRLALEGYHERFMAALDDPNAIWNQGSQTPESFPVDGFPCHIEFHGRLKHWCGYVGVPPDAPIDVEEIVVIDGVTWDKPYLPDKPESAGLGLRWLGFAASNSSTIDPVLIASHIALDGTVPDHITQRQTWWTKNMVTVEVHNMARQIAAQCREWRQTKQDEAQIEEFWR